MLGNQRVLVVPNWSDDPRMLDLDTHAHERDPEIMATCVAT